MNRSGPRPRESRLSRIIFRCPLCRRAEIRCDDCGELYCSEKHAGRHVCDPDVATVIEAKPRGAA